MSDTRKQIAERHAKELMNDGAQNIERHLESAMSEYAAAVLEEVAGKVGVPFLANWLRARAAQERERDERRSVRNQTARNETDGMSLLRQAHRGSIYDSRQHHRLLLLRVLLRLTTQEGCAMSTEREAIEKQLYEELGFTWKRQNSALTVTIFEPFKVESLVPIDKTYRAHFLMDDAWAALVAARLKLAAADRLVDKVRAKIDNCPACRGTGQTELTQYDSASNAMEWAGFEDCRKCSALRSALLEYSRTKSLRR